MADAAATAGRAAGRARGVPKGTGSARPGKTGNQLTPLRSPRILQGAGATHPRFLRRSLYLALSLEEVFHVNTLRTVVAACALLSSAGVLAHGYMTQPASRTILCKQGGNSACGAIQWEPQSLEAPSGFPQTGPADGLIAAAGLAQFGELNEQTSSRWAKQALKAGANTFSWQFTANHASRNWRYYITKALWNPNQPLSRAAFEPAPFCSVDGANRQPPMQLSHVCDVPARSGYQVILGVWEVADTPNSFYNVVDVVFSDAAVPPPEWGDRGVIYPSLDLAAGDSVNTRVFDAAGEKLAQRTTLRIGSASEGLRNNWAFQLATRINAEQALLRAGQMGRDGSISPVYGQNTIYAKAFSGTTRVEVQINRETLPPAELTVTGLDDAYLIRNGQLRIDFNVSAASVMEVSAYVYDAAGVAKGFDTAPLNNNSAPLSIDLNEPAAGAHQLVIKGVPAGGGAALQKTFALALSVDGAPAHDYQFPASLASYKAGTRVLQPKDGKVYTCKPFPYSGWCAIWSPTTVQYEPGVGAHWQDAWAGR
jgi:predicted carbohydrate-binding protein with CBM5 and CBM33 domain